MPKGKKRRGFSWTRKKISSRPSSSILAPEAEDDLPKLGQTTTPDLINAVSRSLGSSDSTLTVQKDGKGNCRHLEDIKFTLISMLSCPTYDVLKAVEYLTLVGYFQVYARKDKKIECPLTLDCFKCACLVCKKVLCVNDSHSLCSSIQHYEETGHRVGYLQSKIFCLQCNEIVTNFKETNVLNKVPPKRGRKRKQPPSSSDGLLEDKIAKIVYLRGLMNLGNTCFMNSILQVILHTPMIQFFFTQEDVVAENPRKRRRRIHNGLSEVERVQEFSSSLVGALKLLFQEFQLENSDPFVPNEFLVSIRKNVQNFAEGRQHDAHEFFISVLNVLHKELLQMKNNWGGRTTRSKSVQMNKSPIDDIFLGRLQSEVTCMDCGHSRIIIDPFWDASLEVCNDHMRDGNVIHLSDLLNRFTRIEHLDETEVLQCPCCAKRTNSTKQLSFKNLPPVICLHLKRFEHSRQRTTSYRKIQTEVSIPDFIDFSPYKSDSVRNKSSSGLDQQPKNPERFKVWSTENWYSLYAIVTHSGSHHSGHYHTYIKKASFWFKCDDIHILQCSRAEALSGKGYLLFYKKVNVKHCIFER